MELNTILLESIKDRLYLDLEEEVFHEGFEKNEGSVDEVGSLVLLFLTITSHEEVGISDRHARLLEFKNKNIEYAREQITEGLVEITALMTYLDSIGVEYKDKNLQGIELLERVNRIIGEFQEYKKKPQILYKGTGQVMAKVEYTLEEGSEREGEYAVTFSYEEVEDKCTYLKVNSIELI